MRRVLVAVALALAGVPAYATGPIQISGGGAAAPTATAPIVVTSNNITCNAATGSVAGCLSSTDWSTFNSKQSALSFTAPLVNTAGTVACTLATTSTSGCVSATTQTFSGAKTFDTAATFSAGLTIPTAQNLNLNAGGTTKLSDASGDLRIDLATGKVARVYVNGVSKFKIDDSGDIYPRDGAYSYSGANLQTNQIYGPTNTTQIKFNSALAAGNSQADVLITSQNVRTAGTLFNIDNNGGSSLFNVDYTGLATANMGVTIPTAKALNLNVGATTKIADSSGDLQITTANKRVYFSGTGGATRTYIDNDGSFVMNDGTMYVRGATYGHVYFSSDVYGGTIAYNMGASPTDSASNTAFSFNGRISGGSTMTAADIAHFRNNTAIKATVRYDGLGTFYGGVAVSNGSDAMTYSKTGSAVIDFGSLTATCEDSAAITVTSAAFGDTCQWGTSTEPTEAANYSCYVSSAGNVKVKACAPGAGVNPASRTFYVRTTR